MLGTFNKRFSKLVSVSMPAIRALETITTQIGIFLLSFAIPLGIGFVFLIDRALCRIADGIWSKYQLAALSIFILLCLSTAFKKAISHNQRSNLLDQYISTLAARIADLLNSPYTRLASSALKTSSFLHVLILWGIWLAWVAFWWNRSFYPFDMGREPTIAFMWLHGFKPYADHFMSHHTLGGVIFYYAAIKAFGFVPYIWNLMFVIWFGSILTIIFKLLCRVIPSHGSLVITASTVIFVSLAEFTAYFQYYWQGMLLALLAVQCFASSLCTFRRIYNFALVICCALFTILTLSVIPQYGIVLVITFSCILAVRLINIHLRKDTFIILITLVFCGFVFLGLVVIIMNYLGILEGYYQWILSLRRVTTSQFGTGSILQTMSNWTYAISLYKGSYLSRYSWPAFCLICSIWFLRKVRPEHFQYYYSRFQAVYWSAFIVGVIWIIIDFRQAITGVNKYYQLLRTVPPTTILLSVIMFLGIGRTLIKGTAVEKQEGLHWLTLLLFGAGVYLSIVQTHRTLGYALAMSLIYTPVVLAYVWFSLPQSWGFIWPRGSALVLVFVMVTLGASQKILDFPYGGSWFDRWEYFKFPALRYMQATNAAEMDKVLFLAKEIVEQGGKILVYPRQITFYPLLNVLPPTPFPDLDFRLYCYPEDADLWRKATSAIDESTPQLIIVEQRNFSRETWLKVRGDDVHIPRVVREAYDDYYLNMPSLQYQMVLEGPTYFVYRLRE